MTTMISGDEKRVLAALARNPVASLEEMGSKTRLSAPTVSKKIKDLVERRILQDRFVSAQISYSAVGLETVLAFLQSDVTHWSPVENSLDLQPYTQYRTRCLGSVNGFFAIFSVPHGGLSMLIDFLDELKGLGLIKQYRLHRPLSRFLYVESDFNAYDEAAFRWKLDWRRWKEILGDGTLPLPAFFPSVLERLNEADMKILRLLSVDARMPRKEMARQVGVQPYTLSKRLRFYNENGVITGYWLAYDSSILGLTSNIIIKASARVKDTQRVAHAVTKLPFQSALFPVEGGFILYSSLPAQEFPKLATALQQQCTSLELMWCDYTSSKRYYFDNEPSNYGSNSWTVSREYMVEEVLRNAGLSK